jgi:hypothetical protein
MPTTQPDNNPQSSLLSAVRESQAAVIDVIHAWTGIAQQLTRDLRLPIARIDLNEAVDRVFDVAEQTLAAQREFALTVAGVATRQIDIAVDTAAETIDTAVEAADTTAETLEGTVRERAHQVEAQLRDRQERVERAQAGDAPKAEPPKQDRRPDGRTYEERSVEELRERAAELQIEGRSAMSKDELIAALRDHRKSRSAKSQAPTQGRPADRRAYEESSNEELRERARELDVEGRSTMTKDELIAALRQQAR